MILKLFREYIETKLSMALEETKLLVSNYRSINDMFLLSESDKQVVDYDLLRGGRLLGDYVSRHDISDISRENEVRNARLAYEYHPNLGGAIDVMKNYICGPGFSVVPDDESDIVSEFWDEFDYREDFYGKADELVVRVFRDGECFIRFFVGSGEDGLERGRTAIRFIEPENIKDPTGQVNCGIEVYRNNGYEDVERPLWYYVLDSSMTKADKIPANEILHIKIGVDRNVKRGRSILRRCLKRGEQYNKWHDYRMILAFVRSAIPIVRKADPGVMPGRIGAIRSEQESTKWSDAQNKLKMFKPGTIIDAKGFTYQMLSPNLDAKDSEADGRRLKLDIAAGLGVSELYVSADASNANYSSLAVAETPAIMTIKNWQKFFNRYFQKIYREVIKNGVEYGLLPSLSKKLVRKKIGNIYKIVNKTVPLSLKANIIPPSVVPRKLLEESQAYVIHRNNRWASDETIQGKLGYVADQENARIDYEEYMAFLRNNEGSNRGITIPSEKGEEEDAVS